jgi:hypothetical protein
MLDNCQVGLGMQGAVRDLKHGRMHLLQRIDALLELDVVRGELSLSDGVSAFSSMVVVK